MRHKQLTGAFLAGLLTFMTVFTTTITVKAESVKGLPGEYHVNAETGTVSAMSVGVNAPGADFGTIDTADNIKVEKPGDVTLSFDVYVPTEALNRTLGTDRTINIQPIEYIRVPGMQWYTFFGYTISICQEAEGLEYFSFADHYADQSQTMVDKPDYVSVSSYGEYTKISVKNEPIDTNGAGCFDISEDKEYNGTDAITHFTSGEYRIFCPEILISQAGDGEVYSEDVTYLLTNQTVSVGGAKVYETDYTASNPIGYYTLYTGENAGEQGEPQALNAVTWDIANASDEATKAKNPMTLTVSKKTYSKSKDLKTKKSFSIGVKKAQGAVTYTLDKKAEKAKIKVSKKGKVTVPANCKTGSYTITVKAKGNDNYLSGKKNVTIKVKK